MHSTNTRRKVYRLPCGAGSTVPREGFDSSVIMSFSGVLWLWHFLYSVGPNPVSSLHIYTFVVSRAFMVGAPSQVGDADSSRAPGLASGLLGSVNVHLGALLLVPQWQCISSFVFYFFFISHSFVFYCQNIFVLKNSHSLIKNGSNAMHKTAKENSSTALSRSLIVV